MSATVPSATASGASGPVDRRVRVPLEGVTYCDPLTAGNYLRSGGWLDRTVAQQLRETAQAFKDRTALICDDQSLTFSELDGRTDCLAAALLRLGLRPGDRAMFQMGTSIETAIALLSCYKAGVIPVCAVPQYREVEIGHLCRLTAPAAYFVQADVSAFDLVAFAARMQAEFGIAHLVVARAGEEGGSGIALEALSRSIALPEAREILSGVDIGCADVLSFQLSGGTTGIPKVIPRFHGEYLAHSRSLTTCHGLDAHSRMIWSLPLIHNAGQLYALMPVVWGGITSVLMPRVDIPQMLSLIERHRITHALSIGPVAPQLLAYQDVDKHDLSSLRLFATMSRADKLEAHIPVPCANLFGITEGLLLGTPGDAPRQARHGTQGLCGCELTEIRLLHPGTETPVGADEIGELCFRGPSSLRGYYGSAANSADTWTTDGFVRTGDLMRRQVIEGTSYFSFQGRLRDNVNRGGEKIGSEEVEAFVSRHAAVADAKLVAMPDPIYGEKGCVFIVLAPGAGAPTVKELADFLVAQGLAKFKCPERIEVVEAFPVTRVGKVDKAAMRRTVADMLAAAARDEKGQDA